MSIALITGSAGLIGAEAARFFSGKGMTVVGIDNDMRQRFFGADASTRWSREALEKSLPRYRHVDADIRDDAAIQEVFSAHGRDIAVVIHCAAQPSHDWAARDPVADFTVNANGTLTLLQATRQHCPDAPFIFCSTAYAEPVPDTARSGRANAITSPSRWYKKAVRSRADVV